MRQLLLDDVVDFTLDDAKILVTSSSAPKIAIQRLDVDSDGIFLA